MRTNVGSDDEPELVLGNETQNDVHPPPLCHTCHINALNGGYGCVFLHLLVSHGLQDET
jgi:hypothetical protein